MTDEAKRFQVAEQAKGSPWLKELHERFAPVREQAAKFTEEEINADIDRAVAEARHPVAWGCS